MAEFDFNKMFQGDYSGLLNNNNYAQNVKRSNSLSLDQGLISENSKPIFTSNNQRASSQSFAEPEYQDRTLVDKFMRRENPENAELRNSRNKAMVQDYMYNQIDNDEDRLLFSLDPKSWIAKDTDSKFKDENRAGFYKGRPYTTRKDTGLLHYIDGAQEQVFLNADSSKTKSQHSTIQLYNEYKKATDPVLKEYLLRQLEALGQSDDSLIQVSVAPDGTQSITIGGTNTSGSNIGSEKGFIKMSGTTEGTDNMHIVPSDITSYLDDNKYTREFEASYQSDQSKALKFNGILDSISDIGIDYLLTQKGAIEQFGIEKVIKFGGVEFAKAVNISDDQIDRYSKATGVIAEQTGMLNAYIKEITGAQMSETEVKRLVQALANMGVTGSLGRVFGNGDNPIAFKMKYDMVMKHIQEARARRYFYMKNESIMKTLEKDYPALQGIDYELNTRHIENDVYTMTKSKNPEADLSGEIDGMSYTYGTNQNYWMDDFRTRDLMSQVQNYDLSRNRYKIAAEQEVDYQSYLSILTDKSHPENKKFIELDLAAQLESIQSRNKLFGLGKNELTFAQRELFKNYEPWQNRKRDGGSFYKIDQDKFLNSMGVQ